MFDNKKLGFAWHGTRVLRYFSVGVLNTVFGYSLFLIGLQLGFHYSLAIALATVIGIFFNFKSLGTVVFNSHNNSRLVRFIGVYCTVYGLNLSGVAGLIRMGLPEWLAGLVLLVPVAIFSYFLLSRYVFQ